MKWLSLVQQKQVCRLGAGLQNNAQADSLAGLDKFQLSLATGATSLAFQAQQHSAAARSAYCCLQPCSDSEAVTHAAWGLPLNLRAPWWLGSRLQEALG